MARAARSLLTIRRVALPVVEVPNVVEKMANGRLVARGVPITTETRDRMGDIVRAAGGNFAEYAPNPVVLWAHDSSLPPIGTSSAWTPAVIKNGLPAVLADITFSSVGQLSQDVAGKWQEGTLRAVSIGFVPDGAESVRVIDPDGKPVDEVYYQSLPQGFGYEYLRWKLLEFSVCPIPANPDAVGRANREALTAMLADCPTVCKSFSMDARPALVAVVGDLPVTKDETPGVEDEDDALDQQILDCLNAAATSITQAIQLQQQDMAEESGEAPGAEPMGASKAAHGFRHCAGCQLPAADCKGFHCKQCPAGPEPVAVIAETVAAIGETRRAGLDSVLDSISVETCPKCELAQPYDRVMKRFVQHAVGGNGCPSSGATVHPVGLSLRRAVALLGRAQDVQVVREAGIASGALELPLAMALDQAQTRAAVAIKQVLDLIVKEGREVSAKNHAKLTAIHGKLAAAHESLSLVREELKSFLDAATKPDEVDDPTKNTPAVATQHGKSLASAVYAAARAAAKR